ncbi:MAG: DUF6443 domain-containing protein [Bacteroidales bacterium]
MNSLKISGLFLSILMLFGECLAGAQVIWDPDLGRCPDIGDVNISCTTTSYVFDTDGGGNEEADLGELEESIRSQLSDYGYSWVRLQFLDIVNSDSFQLTLTFSLNTGTSNRSVVFSDGDNSVRITQEHAFFPPAITSPEGTMTIAEGAYTSVALSNTVSGSSYPLMKTTGGSTSTVYTIVGNGGTVTVPLVLGEGIYTVSGATGTFTVVFTQEPEASDTLLLTDTLNWILTRSCRGEGLKDICSVTYYDGLGYPEQEIAIEGSGDCSSDLIICHVNDFLFRETGTYLPYPVASNRGAHVSSARSGQDVWYRENFGISGATAYAWTATKYESVPDGRRLHVTRPGDVYHSGDLRTSETYRGNSSGEVLILDVDYVSGVMSVPGYYEAGTLSCVTTTDEDGHEKSIFTDLDERTVLERSRASEADTGAVYADTYYGYDVRGNLRRVVSPEGSRLLSPGAETAAAEPYSHIYAFDSRGHMIEKTVPGASVQYSVYDKGDREVMRQDGNLRQGDRWVITKYDGAGRVTGTKLVTGSADVDRDSLQSVFDSGGVPALYESSSAVVLTENTYDSYPPDLPMSMAFIDVAGVTEKNDTTLMNASVSGLLTYETLNVLGTSDYVERAYYYDYHGNVIQTAEKRPDGEILRSSAKYDLQGNVSATGVRFTDASRDIDDFLSETFVYDDRGRMTGALSNLNGTTAQASFVYDALGRPDYRVCGDPDSQAPVVDDTRYNLQGWQASRRAFSGETEIFSDTLRYYDAWNGSTPCFDGNISSWTWSRGEETPRSYAFSYDGLSRLTGTEQFDGSALSNLFTERDIRYDRNGNILSLERHNSLSGAPDSLAFTYDGNRRSSYGYDHNGNLTDDATAGVQADYNLLNLPQRMISADYNVYQTYLADGTKLGSRQEEINNGYYYAGPFRYYDNDGSLTLEGASFTCGRIEANGGSFAASYYITDHLGSVRAVVDEDGTVSAEYDYLPYGELSAAAGTTVYDNSHLYCGKELQGLFGIDWYDSGARFQTTSAIFTSLDPLSDKYPAISPYAYCADNPVNIVDPDGMSWRPTYEENEDGNITFNGYEWVPEDQSYDENGKLLDGLYAQAIFFSDNGTFNSESKHNIGSSTAIVYLADGATKSYDAMTYPSNTKLFATVPEGKYHSIVGSHHGSKGPYMALKMRDENAALQTIDLGVPNPYYNDGRTYATGIDIHKAGNHNYTGTYSKDKKGVSQGCLLIDVNTWQSFIGNFNTAAQKNNTISVTVSRSMSSPANRIIRHTMVLPKLTIFNLVKTL